LLFFQKSNQKIASERKTGKVSDNTSLYFTSSTLRCDFRKMFNGLNLKLCNVLHTCRKRESPTFFIARSVSDVAISYLFFVAFLEKVAKKNY